MVIFGVMLAQTIEDRERLFGGSRTDNDLLETAFQRPVFLDRGAVLVGGGSTDALHLAPCQSGFEDIGCVKRALRVACADNRMNLIDEKYHLRMTLQLLQYRFHTLLKLSAIGGTRHHGSHVECNDTLARQGSRLIAHDTQCQSLHDSRLPHTGFADEDRVVLLATRQNLHYALNLHLTPDHRVEFARLRLLGEVVSVLVECGGCPHLARISLRATRLAILHITPLPHSCRRGLSGSMRLSIEFNYLFVGDSPRICQIECGTVDTVAQNSQQQMSTADRICPILTADTLGDTHNTLYLHASGNRFDSVPLFLLQSGVEVSFGFFGRQSRLTQQVKRLTFRQAQNTQHQVFGQNLRILQTLRFIAGVNQDFI